jgi:hypothetical protein
VRLFLVCCQLSVVQCARGSTIENRLGNAADNGPLTACCAGIGICSVLSRPKNERVEKRCQGAVEKNMSRLIVLNGLIGAMGGIFACVNEGRWMMTWEGRAHFDPSLMRLPG